MKEFVEKLIGRLEEETYNMEICEEQFDMNSPYFMDVDYKMVKFDDAKTIINELAEEYSADTPQKSAAGWIPCSERLPEGNDDVMVIYTDNEGEVDICCLDWFLAYSDTMLVWMPLPEPYKPQKEAEWKNKVMKHFTKTE